MCPDNSSNKKSNIIVNFISNRKNKKQAQKEQKNLEKQLEAQYKRIVKANKKRLEEDKIELPDDDVFLSLKHVDKIYDNYVQAVYDFNLDIKKHEFIVFVGPSGCGKSTTLRMIAGLEDITAGDLFIDGKYANNIPPKNRDMAMVFQSYALYPHMDVYNNMAFSLKLRGVNKEEIYNRVKNAAKILELGEYLDRKPKELSGGQRQRVALGRAIVRNASVFLMDEPLSNLDAKLRVQMRSEIVKLHNTLNATTIYVTHDQTEAMTMATRIVVMKKGYIQQIGTPDDIYKHPANTFVATFIGSPAMNLLDIKLNKDTINFKNGLNFKLAQKQMSLISTFYENYEKELLDKIQKETDILIEEINNNPKIKNKEEAKQNISSYKLDQLKQDYDKFKEHMKEHSNEFILGIRPEDIKFANQDFEFNFEVEVSVAELLGKEYYVHFNFADKEIISKLETKTLLSIGDKLKLAFDLDNISLFDPLTTRAIF